MTAAHHHRERVSAVDVRRARQLSDRNLAGIQGGIDLVLTRLRPHAQHRVFAVQGHVLLGLERVLYPCRLPDAEVDVGAGSDVTGDALCQLVAAQRPTIGVLSGHADTSR